MTRAAWVVALVVTASIGCSNNWQRYTWEEAGVSLAFPVTPSGETTEVIATAFGPLKVHWLRAKKMDSLLGTASTSFTVQLLSLDENGMEEAEPPALFKDARLRLLEMAKGLDAASVRQLSDTDFCLGATCGREVVLQATGPDKVDVRQRTFMAGDRRLITLLVITPHGLWGSAADAVRFLESFEICPCG